MKCKKCLLFLLSFLIVLSSLGVAFNVHFCKGTIASIAPEFSQTKTCEMSEITDKKSCCKKKNTSKKCCSDKKVSFKSKAEKISFKPSFIFDAYFVSKEVNIIFESSSIFIQNSKKEYYSFESNAPPLYKLYCKLTFYA